MSGILAKNQDERKGAPMERAALAQPVKWNDKPNRKPLILQGARHAAGVVLAQAQGSLHLRELRNRALN